MFNTLETSEDLLKLRQKQAKELRLCLHQKNAQQFGEKKLDKILSCMKNTNENREKGTKGEKKWLIKIEKA